MKNSKTKVLYIVVGLLSVMVLGLSATLFYTYTTNQNSNDAQSSSDKATSQDKDTEGEAQDSDTHSGVDVANYPSYELSLGKKNSLTVPEGWYVKNITVKAERLSQEEIALHGIEIDGIQPIHKGTDVVLSNDRSEVHLAFRPLFTFGPIGFTCEPFTLEDGWEVVQEATSEDDFGIVRKQDGDRWIYESYYLMEECLGEQTEYGFVNVDNKEVFVFEGSEKDEEVVRKLFNEAFIEDNFYLQGPISEGKTVFK
jgi:hypothetical protein